LPACPGLPVSEKNSSRKLAEQTHNTRIRSNRITLGKLEGALKSPSRAWTIPRFSVQMT